MYESKPEPIFVDGLFIKDRNEKTPDFILASYSINVQKLQAWLATHQDKAVKGWLNIDIKKSGSGSKYAQLNTFQAVTEPKANVPQSPEPLPIVDNETPAQPDLDVSDIPFN